MLSHFSLFCFLAVGCLFSVGESYIQCGGPFGIPCPRPGHVCVPDPFSSCTSECGNTDCFGVCAKRPKQGSLTCGGILGTTCGWGKTCIDTVEDSCNAQCGGADCAGECWNIMDVVSCRSDSECPSGKVCAFTSSTCDPECGDTGCVGLCVRPAHSSKQQYCNDFDGPECNGRYDRCFDVKGDGCSDTCGGFACDGFCGKYIYR